MRQLRDDIHLILDGEVRVYRRERSKHTLPNNVRAGSLLTASTCQKDQLR